MGNPHPGALIAEYMTARDWSQKNLALRLGISPKTVSLLVRGKAPISADLALSLEKVLGRPARFWLNLQTNYDLARARAHQYTPIRPGEVSALLDAPVDEETLALAQEVVEHQQRLREAWAKDPELEKQWINRMAQSLAEFDD